MSSQTVFMEHSPLTMLKRPLSPNNFEHFMYRICSGPSSHHSLHRVGSYTPANVDDRNSPTTGAFTLAFYGGALELGGVFFRNQTVLNEYLLAKGIAVKKSLVDLNFIASRGVRGGGVLFLEKIKYIVTQNPKVLNMAKTMLKVSNDSSKGIAEDSPFLRVRGGKLVHSRTGDSIPEDQWIPLYRPGTIFGEVPTDTPIDLEVCDHVIF